MDGSYPHCCFCYRISAIRICRKCRWRCVFSVLPHKDVVRLSHRSWRLSRRQVSFCFSQSPEETTELYLHELNVVCIRLLLMIRKERIHQNPVCWIIFWKRQCLRIQVTTVWSYFIPISESPIVTQMWWKIHERFFISVLRWFNVKEYPALFRWSKLGPL